MRQINSDLPVHVISVLLIVMVVDAFLYSSNAYPMKRFFKRSKCAKQRSNQIQSLEVPPDIIRLILSIHPCEDSEDSSIDQCEYPWQEIARIYRLCTVSKSWLVAICDQAIMAKLLNIPRLHYAAGVGNHEAMIQYKLAGDSILEPDPWLFMPDHYALAHGHFMCCKMLRIGGAFKGFPWDKKLLCNFLNEDDIAFELLCDPSARGDFTPENLMRAIQSNNVDMVLEILFCNPDLATYDHFNESIAYEHQLITILICFSLQGKYENWLFEMISKKLNENEEFFDRFKIIGANPNAFDVDGETFLHKIASNNIFVPMLKQLLTCKGINIHIHDKNIQSQKQFGNTPIHNAALTGADMCLQELLNVKECDVNILDAGKFGQSPLFDAIDGGSLNCADRLLKHGAKISEKNKKKRETALHWAIRNDRYDILMRLLKADQCCVDIRDDYGLTPLHRAAISKNSQYIELLVSFGADVNARTLRGNTPLHLACKLGGRTCLNGLLSIYGCDINATNNSGNTPLHYAARRGSLLFVKSLIAAGAIVDVINKNGKTACDCARDNGHKKIVDYFLSLSVDDSIKKKG